MGHATHVSWSTSAKRFDYCVHWVMWRCFQQFIVKIRGQVKKFIFSFHKCQQKGSLSDAVWAQESKSVFYFVIQHLEHAQICIWVIDNTCILWYPYSYKKRTKCISQPFFYKSSWKFQKWFILIVSLTYIHFSWKPKIFLLLYFFNLPMFFPFHNCSIHR